MNYIQVRLWLGPFAAVLLFSGMFAVGLMIPGYSHVRQTVSELGEVGSPGRISFTVLLLLVAGCLIVSATGVYAALRAANCSTVPAFFVGAMAVSAGGVGVFAYPNPLHNVFGMSELIGYQAPLVAALVCRAAAGMGQIRRFSFVMYVLVVLAIAANMTSLHRHGDLWLHIRPFYGVVQRMLFAAWFFWCAGYALLLMRMPRARFAPAQPTAIV